MYCCLDSAHWGCIELLLPLMCAKFLVFVIFTKQVIVTYALELAYVNQSFFS